MTIRRHLAHLTLFMVLLWLASPTPASPAGWGTPEIISDLTNEYSPGPPVVAADRDGNAVAVWSQFDGTAMRVRASRYTPAGGWGTPEIVDVGGYSQHGVYPRVAMDGAANALVVWAQVLFENGGQTTYIYSNRHDSLNGWGTPTPVGIASQSNFAFNYTRIAANEAGDAVVVWERHEGDPYAASHDIAIYASRFSATTKAWGSAQVLATGTGDYYAHPRVGVDSNGNAHAVWRLWNDNAWDLFSSRYAAAPGSWSAPGLIEELDTDANDPDLAVDAAGNAIAVWSQYNGVPAGCSYCDSIYANRYDTSAGAWGEAQLLEENYSAVYYPKVAVDSAGNAVAVWNKWSEAYASRYAVGSGWGPVAIIGSMGAAPYNNSINFPQVAMDGPGNAIATWHQGVLPAARYNAVTSTWDEPEAVSQGSTGILAPDASVAFDGAGNAFAVWAQDDGTGKYRVHVNRYEPVGAPVFTVTVTRTGAGSGTVTADSGDIACPSTCADDYPAGSTVTLSVAEDAGSLFIGWAGGCSGTGSCILGPLSGNVSVTARFERRGSVRFTAPSFTVSEAAGSVQVVVERIGGSAGPASVQYATFSGTAVVGSDFAAISGPLTWSDGAAGAKTISIPIINDPFVEADETFAVTLSDASGAVLGAPATATVTIVSDDGPTWMLDTVRFSSARYNVKEGAAGGYVRVTVQRVKHMGTLTSRAVSVHYATADGTAVAPGDYTAKSGDLSWPAGDMTARYIDIPIADDHIAEGNETFTVTLSAPAGARLGSPSVATVTIKD
jgi:hypothetical protein